jgi:hypothetical protein
MSFLDTTIIPPPGWRRLSDVYMENTVSSRITVSAYYSDAYGKWIVSASVEAGTVAADDVIEAGRLIMEARRFLGLPEAMEVIEL